MFKIPSILPGYYEKGVWRGKKSEDRVKCGVDLLLVLERGYLRLQATYKRVKEGL